MPSQTYFIAEIGKACNGDLSYCQKLLHAVKNAGAQAVRFHHFSLEESVYREVLEKTTERAWSFKLHLPFLKERLFSYEEYQTILRWCHELGLDFIATPWDFHSLTLFKRLEVTRFKVHSLNAMNIPLVRAILQLNPKLYLSTGGMSETQVKALCAALELADYDAVLMHAVTAYPAPSNIINMRAIELLKKYHPIVGYASNDLLKTTHLAACASGASVFEKHVHLDGEEKDLHKASVTLEQFATLIEEVREMELLLSRKIKQESRGEMVNQDILSKSLVLKEDVPEGTILDESNLTMQIPSKAANAKEWFHIVGKKAARSLKKGEYLYTSDAQEQRSLEEILNNKIATHMPSQIPGNRGVVVRLKDIDEMIAGRQIDFVEVHYAAGDLKGEDVCKDYDLDLVVHLPEYADGKLLDLCSHDEPLRQFSIEVINRVMQKARRLQPHFKKSQGKLKFIVHPGSLTCPLPDSNPQEQYGLFLDSLNHLDAQGLEVLIENMTPFAWFLENDWSPKQGMSNSFLDAEDLARFCKEHNYSMCLDFCHAQLYCNHAGKDLYTYMKTVRPYVKHLHFSDCTGIDGEGLQIGDGEVNWQDVCEVFANYTYGWTPEIWNGHHDHGEKFYEAHDRLHREFMKYKAKNILFSGKKKEFSQPG